MGVKEIVQVHTMSKRADSDLNTVIWPQSHALNYDLTASHNPGFYDSCLFSPVPSSVPKMQQTNIY